MTKKQKSTITIVDVATAFLNAVKLRTNLQHDAVLADSSMFDSVQKTEALLNGWAERFKFSIIFPSLEEQREVGLNTLVSLGVEFRAIEGVLNHPDLSELKKILKDVPKHRVKEALNDHSPT